MLSTFPIRLDYYQYAVETWVEIFKTVNFTNIHTVLDICPGWSPKLELALIKTSFSGTVYIIDKSKKNLDCLEKLLEPFPKNFQVKTIPNNIFTENMLQKNGVNSFDLVLANHVVDDLVLDQYLENKADELTESEIFADPKILKEIWAKVLKERRIFDIVGDKLRNCLSTIVGKGGLVLIAQYLGYQESLYYLNSVFEECKTTTSKIKTALVHDNDFIEDKELPTKVFNNKEPHYFSKEDFVCLRRLPLPE